MSDSKLNLELLFDTKKLKKAVSDLLNDPGLSEKEKIKLELEAATRLARHRAITDLLAPLCEAFHKDRRRIDKNYDPEKDDILKNTHNIALTEADRVWSEFEPMHELRKRIWAAGHARNYILDYMAEICKIYYIAYPSAGNNKEKITDE